MIVIIGGGICGLGVGWHLARSGAGVTVFERGVANGEATWAAAGMLAPQVEAEHGEEALLPLAMESRDLWAEFAGDLQAESGIDVDYRAEGTLVIGLDRDDREYLEHRFEYFKEMGLGVQWLSGYEARQKEPYLARAVTGAIYSPLDHQVDNRKVGDALKAAYLKAGGVLHEHTEVEEILIRNGRVQGVRVNEEEVAAEAVVLAAGAWSRNIPGLPDSIRPPVRPLKGQMVALQMPRGAPLIDHVVWGPGNSIVPAIYLAPKGDGRLIVGATVEEMGFDTDLTAGGLFELMRSAWEALPGVYDLPVVDSWAGLRPASRDDAPILGPTRVEGLVMATGHHRNGILLSPVTARSVGDYLLTGQVASIIKPFLPDRFDGQSAASGETAEPLRETI
mgnify:CR=1 FL=1